jgi:hypothetical protein
MEVGVLLGVRALHVDVHGVALGRSINMIIVFMLHTIVAVPHRAWITEAMTEL